MAEKSDSESDDFTNFYSGVAKRFKKEKKVVFPSGVVKLVNKKEDRYPSSARKTSPTRVQQVDDSSDEEIFKNDLDAEDESKEADLDENDVIQQKQQVTKLEDIEDYIVHLSPETTVQQNRTDSSASVQDIDDDEVEVEEDPLFCAPLNDSVGYMKHFTNHVFFIILFVGIEPDPG